LALHGQQPFARLHAQAHDLRLRGVAEGRAGRDPAAQGLVLGAAARDAHAAAVGRAAGYLGQQQAVLWRRREHAPAAALLRQCGVIRGRVEAEHRQLEAVLPLRLAVAARRVAAELAEQRDDVVLEVVAARPAGARHLYGDVDRLPSRLYLDGRGAVGHGPDHA